MNSHSLPLRDRIQLALLRLLSVVLGTVDQLFHVRWGERLLGRMTSRWEARLAKLDEALALLEKKYFYRIPEDHKKDIQAAVRDDLHRILDEAKKPGKS